MTRTPLSKIINRASNERTNSIKESLHEELHKRGVSSDTGGTLGGISKALANGARDIFGSSFETEKTISSKRKIEHSKGILIGDNEFRDAEQTRALTTIGVGSENPNIVFPPDLNDFYIQLDFKDYSRPSPDVTANAKTKFSISLPIPRTLEDKHDVVWNEFNANDMDPLGSIFSQGQGNQGKDGISPYVDNFATAGAYFAKQGLRGLSYNLPSVIAQSLGGDINPHITMAFQQPTLRTHRMNWVFSPNNAKESETIKKITRLIRAASLPAYIRNNEGNANINLLEFPMICQITLYPWADRNKFFKAWKDTMVYDGSLYVYKHCVIESVAINYAPTNVPAFYDSGEHAPAFVELSLQFKEIEYFTADDFGRRGKKLTLDTFGDAIRNATGILNSGSLEDEAVISQLQGFVDILPGQTPTDTDQFFDFQTEQSRTVYREYKSKEFVDNELMQLTPGYPGVLYKTGNGNWYIETRIPNKDTTVEPILSLNDPKFKWFDVAATDLNFNSVSSNTTPVTFDDAKTKGYSVVPDTDNTLKINIITIGS